ncbi:hypothetical protein ABMA28_006241 [Loxostege sticticalis]|uniref:Uncharacterized protein n=1 Tax=Loxostege sticticalis TaxID=481309 RepID=A0ABD0SKH6_LOXSC
MKAALIVLFAVLALTCAQRGRPVDFVNNYPGSVDFVDNNPGGSVDFVDNNPGGSVDFVDNQGGSVDFVDNNPGSDVNFVNNNRPGSFVVDPAFSRPSRPSGGFQRPDIGPAFVNNGPFQAIVLVAMVALAYAQDPVNFVNNADNVDPAWSQPSVHDNIDPGFSQPSIHDNIDPGFSQPSIHDNQGGYQQPNIDPAFVNPPYQYDPQAVVSLDLPGGFKTPSELPKVPDTPSLPDTSKLPDKKVPDLPKDAGTKV